ncbi:MAG: hypothetical protein QM737_16125 [Ferruginibacter sp.]
MSKKLMTLLYMGMLLSLTGCKSMKFSFAENVSVKNTDQKFELVKNQAIITTRLDGKDQRLMLDLGASACVIYDTTVINDFYKREKANFGSAKGAGSGKIKITQVPLSINDNLFSSANKVFTVIDNPAMRSSDLCSLEEKIAGLYGANIFSGQKTILLLNMEEKKLCNLTDSAFANEIANEYQLIKSKFSMYGITVYVVINGKEYPFGFDMGFNGSFTMPAGESIVFAGNPHVSFEGMSAISVTGIETGLTDIYPEMALSFNGLPITSSLMVSSGIKVQNMGMGFIKGFNWIIDYKHKKIYTRKLVAEEKAVANIEYKYLPKIVNGKLLVALKRVGMTDYNVGDEIISVNGQVVNKSNQCELMQMLISNKDWKELNVKTQSRDIK